MQLLVTPGIGISFGSPTSQAGVLPITTPKGIIPVSGVKHSLSLPNSTWIISRLKALSGFPVGIGTVEQQNHTSRERGYRQWQHAANPPTAIMSTLTTRKTWLKWRACSG